MIAHVRGALAYTGADSVVIDVGGVGYRCLVPASTRTRLPSLGQEVLLHTSLQVREDSMTLYGFLTTAEFDLFELLLRVEGIGPKVALNVLSASSSDHFRRAVAFEDFATLCQIPGIGKKTAQRIVIELKDKVGTIDGGPSIVALDLALPSAAQDPAAEAVEALLTLGYARAEAIQAVQKAGREAGEDPTTETLIRLGLKHLFRG